MIDDAPSATRRSAGADRAIRDALIALTSEQRYEAIRVGDITARAGVARSTFYQHYRNKDDVLLAALGPLLLVLATAASGTAARPYVRAMIDHLWRRRTVVRPLLGSSAAPLLERHLAGAIAANPADQGAPSLRLAATAIASAQLATLRDWLCGRLPASVDAMTEHLIACSRLRTGTCPRVQTHKRQRP